MRARECQRQRGEHADRAGPAPKGKRTASGVRGGLSRSIKIGRGGGSEGAEPYDQDRTGEISPGETDVREAAPLLSTAVRSLELRQARARVAPGSPELGRGEEGATANSMARKRP
jgi:hypothetical protein